MIIRYETKSDGIDVECTTVCPFKEEKERRARYESDCRQWIIVKNYSDHDEDKQKALCSGDKLVKKYSCNLHYDLLVFESKDEGMEYLQNMDTKQINDPDQEDGISYWDVEPLYEYNPTRIGSAACQRCKYCYGRSKIYAPFVIVDKDGKLFKQQDDYIMCSGVYNNPDWSMKIRIKRFFYHLWVDKLEQGTIRLCKKLRLKKLYNYLNYR